MTFRRVALAIGLLATTALAAPALAQDAKPAFAEPSLSSDGALIAFASGGDIWEVAAGGGTARPLVTDTATEGRPLYSPDGTRLAFTSTRGGSANIFVLDLASGAVTRLTYAEASEELDAWSPDGKYLYFASGVQDVGRSPDIFRVAADGGTPMQVSRETYLAEFQAAPSPDGSTLVINTRGISASQWWRNGTSHIDETELWLLSIDGGTYRRLLPAGEKHAWPMWNRDGRSIVYMSARGGVENLWRAGLSDGAAPEQLTHFTDGRLLYPAMAANGSAIVFERNFGVWRYDPAIGQAVPVSITLRGAASATARRHEQLQSFTRMELSPDGQKIAVIGHGEVFAASAKDGGPAQRITNTVAAEREVVWSPDSRRALVVSERGLDHRLIEYDVASGRETILTTHGIASTPAYAPDGKSAAYVLNDRELHVVTLGGGADRTIYTGAVATDESYGPRPVWSPDGHYIAFPVTDARSFTNVHIISAAGGKARPVSFLGNAQMGGIAWSPDGTYILFDTAQRSEESRIVRIDLLPHVPRFKEDRFSDLFKPGKQPGTPETPADTPAPAAPRPLPAAGPKKGSVVPPPPPKVPPVNIVWEGLRGRATILPLGLSADTPVISGDGKTLVFRAQEKGRANLYSYNLDELADEPPVAQQLTQSDRPKGDFALSGDGKTLFYLDGGRVVSTPLDTPKPKPVNVAADMDVDFATEKQVVFDEAWSVLDRGFVDADFNGHDWAVLRAKFQPYVAGARTPDDLRRVINLMIGELNASHSGINRPQNGPGSLPTNRVGDIGLRFDRAAYEAGRGLVVREVVTLGPASIEKIAIGDHIVSVGGVPVGAHGNLDGLLENMVGRRVAIGVEGATGARTVVMRPISVGSAAGLAYRQWVEDRRALVGRLSGGKLGYVHLADMSAESLDQLYLDLDAENQGKQGVVVDIRNNNGGFVNGYAIDVFARRNYLTMTPRDLFPIPARQALGQRALGKPTVLVTNESSLSDAEDFTEGYRALGLGKVVGQPTAGWIIFTSSETMIDGSIVRLPHSRITDGRGQDMEMHPRAVDVAVERPLGETGAGTDAQLSAAVGVLLAVVGNPGSK